MQKESVNCQAEQKNLIAMCRQEYVKPPTDLQRPSCRADEVAAGGP